MIYTLCCMSVARLQREGGGLIIMRHCTPWYILRLRPAMSQLPGLDEIDLDLQRGAYSRCTLCLAVCSALYSGDKRGCGRLYMCHRLEPTSRALPRMSLGSQFCSIIPTPKKRWCDFQPVLFGRF